MKIQKIFVVLFSICCFLFGALTTQAADERLGTVVDGSLLVEGMEVEGFTQTMARGTYLGAGSGKLTNKGNHSVNVFGNTTCNKICDEVKVTLHLQRLEGNSWATIYTLGPKVAKNTNYVSNSKNYRIKGGYYYRIKGSHTAIKGSTAESTASYTDGLWIK